MRNKGKISLILCLAACLLLGETVYAQVGDIGFFGGISEGRPLPGTTETLLAQNTTGRGGRRNNSTTATMDYSEFTFLSGRAEQFNGLIDVTSGVISADVPVGTTAASFRVYSSPYSPDDVTVDRLANFNVSFRWEGKQLITNYNIVKTSWRDIITTEAGTFTLDPTLSSGTITIIEDRTPGVNYYRGDFSWTLVYMNGDARTTVDQSGSFYGYDCPWSSTETHRMSVSVMNDDWGLQYEIRPSVTVNKVLQYTRNEPTAISFEGNYKEVLQNIAGLKYDIYVKPITSWDEPDAGEASIQRENTFEQLPEPDLSFMRGNAAEDDIRKLFAMKILDGDPYYYMPSQAITRGQFYTALAKTIKLPIQSAEESRTPSTAYLFNDVDSTMPEYPYIMAIVNAGIAYGRDTGDFGFEEPIQRQEAFVVLVRALGLTNLGLNPTAATFFSDDAQIADWAKREISVALQLGLIAPDSEGRVMPEAYITKGEAAALFNTFIEYMRNVLVSDYAEHIVNIAK